MKKLQSVTLIKDVKRNFLGLYCIHSCGFEFFELFKAQQRLWLVSEAHEAAKIFNTGARQKCTKISDVVKPSAFLVLF